MHKNPILAINNKTSINTDDLITDLTTNIDTLEIIYPNSIYNTAEIDDEERTLLLKMDYRTLYTDHVLINKSYIFANKIKLISSIPLYLTTQHSHRAIIVDLFLFNSKLRIAVYLGSVGSSNKVEIRTYDASDYQNVLNVLIKLINETQDIPGNNVRDLCCIIS